MGRLLDSVHVNVSPRKRSGLKENLSYDAVADALVSIEQDPTEISWCVRIRIPLLVVMNFVTVENERCILRDIHPVVYKVFS